MHKIFLQTLVFIIGITLICLVPTDIFAMYNETERLTSATPKRVPTGLSMYDLDCWDIEYEDPYTHHANSSACCNACCGFLDILMQMLSPWRGVQAAHLGGVNYKTIDK